MADDEQFSLCWNNFNSNLSAGFHESLCRGDLVDVTLAAEGQLVKAHRLVLSVCSPYFRKMFTQMPANQHAFVFLKDVSHSALKDLIQFMYCGEVNVKQEALPAFISTAEALQIKGLTDSDPSPSGQPPSEPTTPTPQMPQVQTSPRLRQQRTVAATRSYKIETVDETSNDSKPQTTQIVIQTTAAQVSQPTAITITQPTATIQHHHHQHQQQQHHHHMQTQHHHQQQQQLQSQSHQISTVSIPSGTVSTVANAATHVVGSSHKRPAQRSSLGSVTHMKRSKTSTIDPLEGAEANGGGGVGAATQQITIQTAIVSDTKTQQQQQNEAAEYIDLPLELPTKSEPDYTDETGEVDPNEQDATYVEDESYGDIRYDESYFAENEDGGGGGGVATTGATTTAVGNINVNNTTNAGNVTVGIGSAASGGGGVVGSAAATTSKAIIKQQQNTSFSDSSYADGTDQTNNDAQDDHENKLVNYRTRSNLPKILDGKFYNNIQPNKKTHGGIQATCTSCFSVISGTTKSTGNFLSHIKRRHKDILPNCQIYCSSKGLLSDTKLPFDYNSALYERPTYIKKTVRIYKKKSIKANAIKVQKKKNGSGYSDSTGDSATGSAGDGHGYNDSHSDEDYIDEILKIKCEPTRKDSSSSTNSFTTPKSTSTAINEVNTINRSTTIATVTTSITSPTNTISAISTCERKPANGIYKKVLK